MSFLLSGLTWKLKIPAARKLVLLALADTASDEGHCWRSKRTIAEKCGMSSRAVDGHIQALADDGLLTIINRKRDDGSNSSNAYQLTLMQKPGGMGQNLRGDGAESAGGDGAESAQHEPVFYEPVIEPVKSKKLLPPDGVSLQTWEDFKTLRKAKRATLTETALNGIRREAEKAGISLQTALETCCERGWQGFKAEWYAKEKQAAPAATHNPYAQSPEDRARIEAHMRKYDGLL